MAENESLQEQLKNVKLDGVEQKPAAPAADARPARSEARPARSEDTRSRDSRPSSGPRRFERGGRRDDRRSNDRYSRRRRFQRRKVCQLCVDKVKYVDYKDVALLRRYVTERSKIKPARMTGCCAAHQRQITAAIKRARNIALLSFKS